MGQPGQDRVDDGAESPRIPPSGALLALLLCVCWGGVSPAIKIAVSDLSPFAVAFWRFLVGLVGIWAWCRLRGIPYHLPRKHRLAVFGFALVFVAQIGSINVGTRLTLASSAVVLVNTSPLFVAMLAHWLFPDDRLTLRKVLGLVLAFSGVAVLFLGDPAAAGSVVGNALALVSGFLLALIQVISKRLVRRLTSIQVVFWEFSFGVPLFALMHWVFEPGGGTATVPAVLSIAYQGLVVAGFCFVAWLSLLRRYSATALSSFQFSIPVFGVILSRLLLGERWSIQLLASLPLVALGIFLVTRSHFRPMGLGQRG